jgi:hypothetical protein
MIGGPVSLGKTEFKFDVKNEAEEGGEAVGKRAGGRRARNEGRLMMVVITRRAEVRMEGDGEQQRG